MNRASWFIMLMLATAVAAYALSLAIVPELRPDFVSVLFDHKPLRAFFHLFAGGTALATGALQFNTGLRERRPSLHRTLGKVYVVAALLSGIAAVLLAPFSDGGISAHFGFGMLGVLWLTATVIAYRQARARQFASHRNWMVRSYALCLAAVTLRIYLPASQVASIPFVEAYPAIAWLCWVPNIVIAEWLIVRPAR
jgi:uncharacterized membrane protein